MSDDEFFSAGEVFPNFELSGRLVTRESTLELCLSIFHVSTFNICQTTFDVDVGTWEFVY